ncbi:MAG: hypothetical protein AAF411_21095 [Myxococcota bacterium]
MMLCAFFVHVGMFATLLALYEVLGLGLGLTITLFLAFPLTSIVLGSVLAERALREANTAPHGQLTVSRWTLPAIVFLATWTVLSFVAEPGGPAVALLAAFASLPIVLVPWRFGASIPR